MLKHKHLHEYALSGKEGAVLLDFATKSNSTAVKVVLAWYVKIRYSLEIFRKDSEQLSVLIEWQSQKMKSTVPFSRR